MYIVLKQKSELLAIEMRLTSLALMFLFFFELASVTISRRTMCLWNEVETKMMDVTGVLFPDSQLVSFSSDQHFNAFTSVY